VVKKKKGPGFVGGKHLGGDRRRRGKGGRLEVLKESAIKRQRIGETKTGTGEGRPTIPAGA